MIRYFLVAAVGLTLVSSKTLSNCPSPPSPSRLYEKQSNANVDVTFVPLSSKLGLTKEEGKYCTCSERTVNNQPVEPIRVPLDVLYVQKSAKVDMPQELEKNGIHLDPETSQSGESIESVPAPPSFVDLDESKRLIIGGEVEVTPVEMGTLSNRNQPLDDSESKKKIESEKLTSVLLAPLVVSTVPEQGDEVTSSKLSKSNELKELNIGGEVGTLPTGLVTVSNLNQPLDGPESKKKIEQTKDLSNLKPSEENELKQNIDLTSSVPSVEPTTSSKDENNVVKTSKTSNKSKLVPTPSSDTLLVPNKLRTSDLNSEPSLRNESEEPVGVKVLVPSAELSLSHKQENNREEPGGVKVSVPSAELSISHKRENNEEGPVDVKVSVPSSELSISHKQETNGEELVAVKVSVPSSELSTSHKQENNEEKPVDVMVSVPSAKLSISHKQENNEENPVNVKVSVPSAELSLSHKQENNGEEPVVVKVSVPSSELSTSHKQENNEEKPVDVMVSVPSAKLSISHKQENNGEKPVNVKVSEPSAELTRSNKQENNEENPVNVKVSVPSAELSLSHKQENNGEVPVILKVSVPSADLSISHTQENNEEEPVDVKVSVPSAELSLSHKQDNNEEEPVDVNVSVPSAELSLSHKQDNNEEEPVDVKVTVPSSELSISHKQETNGEEPVGVKISVPSAEKNGVQLTETNKEPNSLTLLVPTDKKEENGLGLDISVKNQLKTPLGTLSSILNIPENQEQPLDKSKQRAEKKLKETVTAGSVLVPSVVRLHTKQDNNLKLTSPKSWSRKFGRFPCAGCDVPGLNAKVSNN